MKEAMKVILPAVAGALFMGMLMLPEFVGYYELLDKLETAFVVIDEYEELTTKVIIELEKCRSNP